MTYLSGLLSAGFMQAGPGEEGGLCSPFLASLVTSLMTPYPLLYTVNSYNFTFSLTALAVDLRKEGRPLSVHYEACCQVYYLIFVFSIFLVGFEPFVKLNWIFAKE